MLPNLLRPKLQLRHARRIVTHSGLTYFVYRYRYLGLFTLFGFLSIALEIALVRFVLPTNIPLEQRAVLAFLFGVCTSFFCNALANFQVPRRYLLSTFFRFVGVSTLSFVLNMVLLRVLVTAAEWSYGPSRLIAAGVLFAVAYALHRRLTFRSTRNFGIAVYATTRENVMRIFAKVGRACDHVHVDLVDASMNPQCGPVDLSKIDVARRLWPNVPLAMHVMSRHPRHWMMQTLDSIDWFLFHIDGEDDLFELIATCQQHGKRVGVVWHVSNRPEQLLPYLPHVDFVMVLGIHRPGQSGQKLLQESLEVSRWLERIRPRYSFELMFDGSVNSQTVDSIPANYLVAASAVLNAANPVKAICTLKTSGDYERRAA